MGGPFLWIVAALGTYLAWDQLAPREIVIERGPQSEALVLSLANKWGPVFGCPVSTIMTICAIESSFHPGTVNLSTRALAVGGAWGLMQTTLDTCKSHVASLKSHPSSEVQRVLRLWDGTGESVARNPELSVMFGAYQLGKLTKEFKTLPLVAAGYHQGAGKVRTMLAANQPIPAELPPKGKEYVAMAEKAAPRFAT